MSIKETNSKNTAPHSVQHMSERTDERVRLAEDALTDEFIDTLDKKIALLQLEARQQLFDDIIQQATETPESVDFAVLPPSILTRVRRRLPFLRFDAALRVDLLAAAAHNRQKKRKLDEDVPVANKKARVTDEDANAAVESGSAGILQRLLNEDVECMAEDYKKTVVTVREDDDDDEDVEDKVAVDDGPSKTELEAELKTWTQKIGAKKEELRTFMAQVDACSDPTETLALQDKIEAHLKMLTTYKRSVAMLREELGQQPQTKIKN